LLLAADIGTPETWWKGITYLSPF